MGLGQLLFSMENLAELVANLFRIGEVTSVDPERATARVRFEDRDNVESYDLQVLTRGSLRDKFYHMPDIGENVLCLFLPTGVEAGFIIGAYYPATVARPAASGDVTAVEYSDGTRFEYDRAASRMLVDLGTTKITADKEKLRLECNGTYLELDASGWRLNGPRGDLN